jgi:putative transposase
VYVWRRLWRAGGEQALASRGPGGSVCRLDEQRQARLAQALEQGPAVHGFGEDQRWTLARVADLIARLFHIRYTLRGVSLLLHRMGFSPQVPAHRAMERDEQAIAAWRQEAWRAGKR